MSFISIWYLHSSDFNWLVCRFYWIWKLRLIQFHFVLLSIVNLTWKPCLIGCVNQKKYKWKSDITTFIHQKDEKFVRTCAVICYVMLCSMWIIIFECFQSWSNCFSLMNLMRLFPPWVDFVLFNSDRILSHQRYHHGIYVFMETYIVQLELLYVMLCYEINWVFKMK